jgi:hypothetical protein
LVIVIGFRYCQEEFHQLAPLADKVSARGEEFKMWDMVSEAPAATTDRTMIDTSR